MGPAAPRFVNGDERLQSISTPEQPMREAPKTIIDTAFGLSVGFVAHPFLGWGRPLEASDLN
jgi:hypothetical protein